MQRALQLALLEEVRDPEPPIRLSALFYEPGTPEQVATELRRLGDVVVGIGAGRTGGGASSSTWACSRPRTATRCPRAPTPTRRCSRPTPTACSGRSRAAGCRRSATRTGIQLRIDELEDDRIVDEGGDLWHRRIEELDALACALCAHRFAVGHAVLDGRRRAPGHEPAARVLDPRRDAAGRADQPALNRLAQARVEVARAVAQLARAPCRPSPST